MNRVLTILITGLLFAASPAVAITIYGGPEYVPPGAGTETFSGDAALAGGATIDQVGYDLGQTVNLWFGIRADSFINGYSMDGPGISGGEVFRFSSKTANTIVYTAQTTMHTTSQGTHVIPTRMTLTFTGTGTTVEDVDTQALDDATNGDVHALWHVQSANFDMHVLIEAQVPPFDANAGNYEPANDLFNRIETQNSTGTSFDWAFYYENAQAVPSTGTWGLIAVGLLLLAVLGAGVGLGFRPRHEGVS